MYKKVCCTCKIVFWLFNSLLLWLSRCRRRRRILRSLVWTATARRGDKSRSHRPSSMVGREGLVHSIPVLTREYLLPLQWVPRPPRLSTVFTLHQSMAQNLSDMRLSTFVIDAAQLWSVPESRRNQRLFLVFEQKPYRFLWTWFSLPLKSYPAQYEQLKTSVTQCCCKAYSCS